jgi:hypothetical protein
MFLVCSRSRRPALDNEARSYTQSIALPRNLFVVSALQFSKTERLPNFRAARYRLRGPRFRPAAGARLLTSSAFRVKSVYAALFTPFFRPKGRRI